MEFRQDEARAGVLENLAFMATASEAWRDVLHGRDAIALGDMRIGGWEL